MGVFIMRKFFILVVAIAMALALSGCASLFGDKDRTVNVTSVPPNAKVYLNGVEQGSAPAKLGLGNITTNSYVVRVEKKGYASFNQAVKTSFQPIGILNILFWPGFIIDAVTGDMMRIANPDIHAILQKKIISRV
jgi:hypothetical protein